MPEVLRTTDAAKATADNGDRLECTIVIRTGASGEETFLFHTSYKKHLMETYKANKDYTPAYSTENTITTLSLAEFQSAFDTYRDGIAAKLKVAATYDLVVPKDDANRIDTGQGVHIHSDAVTLGASVHCFPCLPSAATASTRAVVLSSDQLKKLVAVCRFLYHTEGFKAGSAEALALTAPKPTGKPDATQITLNKSVGTIRSKWSVGRAPAKKAFDESANHGWLQTLLGAKDFGNLRTRVAFDQPPVE